MRATTGPRGNPPENAEGFPDYQWSPPPATNAIPSFSGPWQRPRGPPVDGPSGLEKPWQEAINLQQTLACQPRLGRNGPRHQGAGFLHLTPGLGPLFQRVDAELSGEAGAIKPPLFEAKDELSDQEFTRCWREPPMDRQPACLHRAKVVIPVGFVLIMHARKMSKAGHTERQEVASLPEHVSVAK